MSSSFKAASQLDPIAGFAASIHARKLDDPRRIGVLLLQAGMTLCAALFCISIAGMKIGMVMAGCGVILSRAPIHRCVGFWWGMAFAGWQMLSRIMGPMDMHGLGLAYIWLCLPMAQLAFDLRLPGAREWRRWTICALVAAVLASCGLSLLQFIIGVDDTRPPWRVSSSGVAYGQTMGFFAFHLTQGSVMGMIYFLFTAISSWMPAPWQWIGRTGAILGLLLSGGRAALLGICTGVGAQMMSQGRRHMVRGVLIGSALLLSGAATIWLMTPGRLQNMLHGRDGRWAIWQTSLHILAEQPIFGAGGPVSFQQAYRTTYPTLNIPGENEFPDGAPHAHNTLLAVAAEHGIPATLLFCLLICVAWNGVRSRNGPAFPATCGFIAMAAVFGQFENFSSQSSHVLWCGLGMVLAGGDADPDGAGVSFSPPVIGPD